MNKEQVSFPYYEMTLEEHKKDAKEVLISQTNEFAYKLGLCFLESKPELTPWFLATLDAIGVSMRAHLDSVNSQLSIAIMADETETFVTSLRNKKECFESLIELLREYRKNNLKRN